MANVNIKFNNKDYILSCEDGQEDNLKELASHLDSKYEELKKKLGNIGENKLLLITSIKIVDEYFDLFKKVKHSKNDFEKLSDKFKELRSLAINYKDEKEIEIDKLKEQLNEFKEKIEKNKNSYEIILDKTTRSIEEFIEKTDSNKEKNIQ
jgi:cell division protein ZapA|tara:strand:+ start:722 stop:1174 length:453 start_codon:yes stop_codon:yes gene_type:complete